MVLFWVCKIRFGQVSEQGGLALGGVRAEGIGRAEFYKEGQIAIEFALER